MRNRLTGVVCVVVCLISSACAGGRLRVGPAKGGEVVEVEGMTPFDPNDLAAVKRRSLAEAQKKAVERVLGVYISAKTRVAKTVIVNQNILANVSGYIRKYDVLREWEADGFYWTRIRALVRYKKVGADPKELGLLQPPTPGNPRVVVVMKTSGGEAGERKGRASSAVRRGLLQRGFSVIDRNDSMQYVLEKSTDIGTVLKEGRKLGADLVVRGDARAYLIRGVDLGGFHSYRARVSLEVFKPESGEMVTALTREASGLDPAPEIAEGKALEAAGLLAGSALAGELADTLTKTVKITLRLLGVKGLPAVRGIADDLRLQPDIINVTLSEYRETGAELRVDTENLAGDQLAAVLMTMKSYRFTTRSVTPYFVEVSVAQ